jgi:hypothetical protein
MYKARSGIVHLGKSPPAGLGAGLAQRTYPQCLEAVASRLDSMTAREADPLRRIT